MRYYQWKGKEEVVFLKKKNGALLIFHGHKIKSIMFGHTHKKIHLKICKHLFFINFLLIIKKILFYVCMTKHYFFGVTILEFLYV